MWFKKLIYILFTNVISCNIWLMAIVTAGLLFGSLFWIDIYTHHNQAIEVPDLRGLQPEEAKEILSRKDLRLQITDSVYSKTIAPGAVVEMIPPAGSKVKQNRIIFLTINAKTSQTVEVPDMFEISQRQAEATLKSLGFVIDSIEYVPYKYKGLVINILKILKDADIRIEGQVVLKLSMASTQSATALYEGTMNAEFEVEKMKLVKIQGMFDPKVENINELVKLNLGDDVDFLKEDANLDFSNPQIYLSLGNNVGIPLKVDMTLWGEDSDGNMIQGSEVAIKDLLIDETEICGESKTTKWAISRTGNVKSGYNVMMVDEISNLMRKIPENVSFIRNVNFY